MIFSKLFSRSFTALVLIIFAAIPALAQSVSDESQVLANQLAEHLALSHKISEVPENIRVQFEQNPLQLPAEKNKRMLRHFDKAYDSNLLLNDFKSTLAEKMAGPYQPEISEWLNSKSTQAITDKRQDYYTLQGKRKRIITMYELDQNPPSSERTDLIASLTDTTSVTESTVESSVIILRSILQAVSRLSERQTFTNPQIDGIANNFRSQINEQVSQELTNQSTVLFHSMKTDTLTEYISFWGTEPGQWLDEAISESIQAAYKAGADRFLKALETDQ